MTPSERQTVQRLIDAAKEAKQRWHDHPLFAETSKAFTALSSAAQQAQDMLHDAKVERTP